MSSDFELGSYTIVKLFIIVQDDVTYVTPGAIVIKLMLINYEWDMGDTNPSIISSKQWIVIISLKNFFPNKSFSFYASILISLMCIVLPTKSTFELFNCRYHITWIQSLSFECIRIFAMDLIKNFGKRSILVADTSSQIFNLTCRFTLLLDDTYPHSHG